MSATDRMVETTPVTPEARHARALMERGSTGEERLFLVLAIFIGVFSGLAVVCFRLAIEWSRVIFLGSALLPPRWRLLIAPTAAGLTVAFLVMKLFPRARGSGVNQTKAALYIYDGYIPFRTAIGKFITSALAIGSGFSLGPEDPSLQIGASIASLLGRGLKLTRERLRLIAPVGAAAGLAAAFNAPISAVLFVIEEVIGRWSAGIFGAVVLSAVSSVVVSRWFLGSEPLFRIPDIRPVQPLELPAFAVLGVLGALLSVVFAKAIEVTRSRLKAMPRWTQYFQPGIAGLLIGGIGVAGAPQVMGAGYDVIDAALHSQFTWEFLAIIVGLKIVATTLSFSSGTPGGMFAPTLFIGGMLGASVAGAAHLLTHHMGEQVAVYALVGMGVLFAAFLRAPMTSVFMVLEVSGDYSIILPVIVANTLAYLISRNLQPVPIFDLLTRQDGLELPSMEEQREETILRVEDAMRLPYVPVTEGGQTVNAALGAFANLPHEWALVNLHPDGWSLASRAFLEQWRTEGKGDRMVSELLPPERLPLLHPDHTLDTALREIHEWSLVPVVHRANPYELLGILSLEDILKAYRKSQGTVAPADSA
jgi:CIC family chloride channel protein